MPVQRFIPFLSVLLLCFTFTAQADAQETPQKQQKRNKSQYLEQAYKHFEVSNSRAQFISKRGVELYAKNDLINKAYSFLQERGKDVNVDEISGIVVDLQKNSNVVHFLGLDVTGGIKGVFAVEFKGSKAVYVHFPKVPEYLEKMYEVYVLAEKSVKGPCQLDYNTIVIEENGEYLAYSIVSEPHPKSVIVGGHFRLKIKEEKGKWKIAEYVPYDTLCVPVGKAFIDQDGRIALNYAGAPHEIHAFLSIQYNQDILIKDGKTNWLVKHGLIQTP